MLTTDFNRNDTRFCRPTQNQRPEKHRRLSIKNSSFRFTENCLDRINLEAVYSTPGDRVRQEIRPSVAKLVNEERTPLSLTEKDRLIEEVLDEVFGLGPLEPLLRDRTVSDILVTTPRLDLCGARRQTGADRHRIQRRRAPDAHHRARGVPGRAAHRRVVADGRRPAAGWLAR